MSRHIIGAGRNPIWGIARKDTPGGGKKDFRDQKKTVVSTFVCFETDKNSNTIFTPPPSASLDEREVRKCVQ